MEDTQDQGERLRLDLRPEETDENYQHPSPPPSPGRALEEQRQRDRDEREARRNARGSQQTRDSREVVRSFLQTPPAQGDPPTTSGDPARDEEPLEAGARPQTPITTPMNRARWGPLATDWEQPSSVRELETEMANLNMGAARHEGLSREALTYALQAAEIRLAQATNPKRNRGSHGDFPQRMTERLSRPPPGARSPWGSFSPPRSGSPVSPRAGGGQGYGGGGGGDPGGSFARPKLQRPSTFRGDYDELYNILNWVYAVDRYLNQCRCSAGDFSGYARTYLDNTVQAYIDSLYSHSIPSWDELRVALIKRYLPPDHVIRVELLFGKLQQRSTLMNYVEQFQVMDAALRFSEIEISNTRKVMQFLQGMREMEERQFLLERDPKSLADLYEGVIICRQAKLLASNLQVDRRVRPKRGSPRRFN